MKKEDTKNIISNEAFKDLLHRLREAKVYTSQGLFAEAKKIYNAILGAYIPSDKISGRIEVTDDFMRLSGYIQNKINEVEQLEKETFTKRPAFHSKDDSVHDNLAAIFNKGVAFKEIGSYDRAISCFRETTKQGYRKLDSLEETGDALILKGRITEGIATLRQAYIEHDPGAPQKTSILDKIAGAYEKSLMHTHLAMEAYQELVLSDKLPRHGARLRRDPTGKKRFRFNFETITRHRWVFLFLSLFVALFFAAFNPSVKVIDNVDYFTVEDNQDAKFYNNFKEIFGSDEFFVIAFKSQDLFTTEKLSVLNNITDDLEMIEEIRDVTSLTNVDDTIGGKDYFEVKRFIEDIPDSLDELEDLEKKAINNNLYVNTLVSEDGTTTAIVVEAFEDSEDGYYKNRLIEKIEAVLAKYKSSDIIFHLAGPTITNYTLSQYMNRDMAIFVPITYCLITVTIWYFFKNIPLTFLALLNISVCVGATRGFMGLTGLTMNNVTSIVVPLVMALSLCDTVHIFSHMDKRVLDEIPDRGDALAHVLKQVALPCFMTTLTTAVGFVSLSVSQIPAIREFAWAAAAGMGFEFFFSFLFLPPLLLFFKPEKIYQEYSSSTGLTQFLHRFERLCF